MASILVLGLVIIGGVKLFTGNNAHSLGNKVTQVSNYKPTDDEKKYLKSKFDGLSATNSDTIAYIYAPGTQLDEPVVQTKDNSTYLDKTSKEVISLCLVLYSWIQTIRKILVTV